MSASNFMENTWLDHVFGKTIYTPPNNIFIGLHTSNPGETGSAGEVATGSYARASLANNTSNFPAASAGVKTTGAVATFATPTAGWGDVSYFTLWDSASGGNCLGISNAFTPQTINTGNTVSFAAGAITVSAD